MRCGICQCVCIVISLLSQLVLLNALKDPIPRPVLDFVLKQQNIEKIFEWLVFGLHGQRELMVIYIHYGNAAQFGRESDEPYTVPSSWDCCWTNRCHSTASE